RPWLVEKLSTLLVRATGRAPRKIFEDESVSVVSVCKSGAAAEPRAARADVDTSTDDWPFLYLQGRGIPVIYRQVLAGFVAAVLLALAVVHWKSPRAIAAGGARTLWTKLAFLLMGVAFLLLETKSVIQFSLLFGTTWLNNSLVFLGILSLVLLANL